MLRLFLTAVNEQIHETCESSEVAQGSAAALGYLHLGGFLKPMKQLRTKLEA
jgi:hypothetical protein